MKKVVAYTDGASQGNPGPSGWAATVAEKVVGGHLPHATANTAELTACLGALKAAPRGCDLHIYTDSRLCIGWLRKLHSPVPHIAKLIMECEHVRKAKGISLGISWVKAHSGNPGNERVNHLAQGHVHPAFVDDWSVFLAALKRECAARLADRSAWTSDEVRQLVEEAIDDVNDRRLSEVIG